MLDGEGGSEFETLTPSGRLGTTEGGIDNSHVITQTISRDKQNNSACLGTVFLKTITRCSQEPPRARYTRPSSLLLPPPSIPVIPSP